MVYSPVGRHYRICVEELMVVYSPVGRHYTIFVEEIVVAHSPLEGNIAFL